MSRIVRATSTAREILLLADVPRRGHCGGYGRSAVGTGCYQLWAALMESSVVRMIFGQAGPGRTFRLRNCLRVEAPRDGWCSGHLLDRWRSVVAYQALVVGVLFTLLSDRLWAVEPVDSTPVMSALATIVLWLLPLVALRPNRRELFRIRPQFSLVLLPLAISAAVPLVYFSIHEGALATGGGGVLVDPAYALTALGVVLAAQAIFASLRPSGTAWLPRFVALAAIWIGSAAIIWPDDVGSLGPAWGAVLAGWGCVFAMAAEALRRTRSSASAVTPSAASELVSDARPALWQHLGKPGETVK